MGVDPGTAITGYAFLEERGGRVRVLEYGVVRSRPTDPLPKRLEKIHRELGALIEAYSPTAMALESAFHAKFPRASIVLGHARGAIMVAAASRGLEVAEYAPSLVKKAASGRGGASKDQVAALMQSHLQLRDLPRPADAADALAVAYCHLLHARSPLL
ncbi:MAG TPA: crossover junction endodeoxyribonuclease RuvC, partial [Fibrobacteria bacterium]|nr:crossover junction endodeoxyribonuclease RuvC [Fibrobacteria bacterium]